MAPTGEVEPPQRRHLPGATGLGGGAGKLELPGVRAGDSRFDPDDIQYAGGAVPLSSVRQPRGELGRSATELLFDEMNDGERHRQRQFVFEPELVVRDSSRLSLPAH